MKTKKKKPLTARQILLRAARVLQKHGWCRGHLESIDGRHCVVGALNLAAVGRAYSVGQSVSFKTALRRLAKITGLTAPTRWNDAYAQDGAEVISALRKAARLAR